MLSHLKSWWGVYGGLITPILIAAIPAAKAFASHHPGLIADALGAAMMAAQRSPNK